MNLLNFFETLLGARASGLLSWQTGRPHSRMITTLEYLTQTDGFD